MKGQVCQLLLSLIVAFEELNSPELKYNNLGNYKLKCRFELQLNSMKIKMSTITNSGASKILSYLCHVTSLKSFYCPLQNGNQNHGVKERKYTCIMKFSLSLRIYFIGTITLNDGH